MSDTSSLVSLDEYKNRNSSGSSLSLSFGLVAHTEPEDDSVTVSSRYTGLLVQKTKTVMNGGSGSTVQDFHSLSGLESESDASAFDGTSLASKYLFLFLFCFVLTSRKKSSTPRIPLQFSSG